MKISYKYHWINAIVNYKLEDINSVYDTAHKVILKSVTSYKLLLLVWINTQDFTLIEEIQKVSCLNAA